jgi:hypothetical protein
MYSIKYLITKGLTQNHHNREEEILMHLFGTRCSGITLTLSDGQTKDLITLEHGTYSDINLELSKEPKDRFLVVSYINTVNKIERQEYYNIDRIERIDASLEL